MNLILTKNGTKENRKFYEWNSRFLVNFTTLLSFLENESIDSVERHRHCCWIQSPPTQEDSRMNS